MHRRWWLNDPDCLLLRDRDVDLAPNERALYAHASGVLDAMLIDSDDLELISPEGKALWEQALSLQGGRVRVDGVLKDDVLEEDGYVISSAGAPAGSIRLAANLSDSLRHLDGIDVPPRSGVFLTEEAV
jgi:alpha-galactosidase